MACFLVVAAWIPVARADDAEICLSSSIQGQVLRQSGRLLRAREHLAECAKDTCEATMRERCATWLKDAEAKTPKLFIVVVDDAGQTLSRADVHLDGTLTQERRVEVDPGKHVLRADFAGQRAILEVDANAPTQEARLVLDLRKRVDERPVPPWVVGLGIAAGVSAASLGAFGTSALVQSNHLRACEPYCPESRKAPLQTAIVGADVSLGALAVTLLAGTVLYLARPTVSREVRVTASGASWAF
jgi:hypothetical protein